MHDPDEEGFLGRWSRLKQRARTGEADVPQPPPKPSPATVSAGGEAPGSAAAANPAAASGQAQEPSAEPARLLSEADFADVDFAALDASSDYTRFMAANVPDAIRQKALARLWTTDPVFAGLDPIHDYHGDYTDAAVAVVDGIKTAYRVGRGFLSDEDVAAWDNLGKPQPSPPPVDEVAEAVPEEAARTPRQPDTIEASGEPLRASAAVEPPALQPSTGSDSATKGSDGGGDTT